MNHLGASVPGLVRLLSHPDPESDTAASQVLAGRLQVVSGMIQVVSGMIQVLSGII